MIAYLYKSNNKTLRTLLTTILLILINIPNITIASPVVLYNHNTTNETLSQSSLVHIYAMQRRVWKDGSIIKVYILPKDSPLHKQFVVNTLHMQPYQLNRLWHRLLYSGTGAAPEEVATVHELLNILKTTPGSIGYIDDATASQIHGTNLRRVDYD